MHDRVRQVLDKQIFFVVGCQKSGTTWVQRLLDGHPEIVCRGEAAFAPVFVPLLNQMLQTYNQQQQYRNAQFGQVAAENLMQPRHAEHLLATASAMMMSEWLNDNGDNVKCIGEKTPEHALALPLLNKAFGRIKVIHIIRDPRDVAVSGWFHNLRTNETNFRKQFPTMAHYVQYLLKNHWLAYIQNAQAFGKQHPDQYFELRYEDLHTQGESLTRQMLTFLDVQTDDAAVQAAVDAGKFQKQAAGRAQGQEDRGSFFRKGVVGDWQNHLDQAALQQFDTIARPMMQQLGYDTMPSAS